MPRTSKFVKGIKPVKGPNHVPKDDRYCVECKHEFQRPSEYRRHINETLLHNPHGSKKYKCNVCDKGFTQAYILKAHKRIHFGPRRLTCDLPLNASHSERCQREYADVRAHIYRDHLGPFRRNGLPVPTWLQDAKKQRFAELDLYDVATGIFETASFEDLTPFDTPLTTPSPKVSHSVQGFSAYTMQPLQPGPLSVKNHPVLTQPKDLDLDLLDLLNSNLTAAESTTLPEQRHPISAAAATATFQSSPHTTSQFSGVPEATLMGTASNEARGQWILTSAADPSPYVTFGSISQFQDDQTLFYDQPITSFQRNSVEFFDIMGEQVQLGLYDYNAPQFYNNPTFQFNH